MAEVLELTEADAVAAISPETIEFDRPVQPGEKLLDWNLGDDAGGARLQARVTDSTTDMRPVRIYTITGEPREMPRCWALERIKLRYPANHATWAGKPCFYVKPPVDFKLPLLPCPAKWGGGCATKFYNLQQVSQHFRNRHNAEWISTESQRTVDQQERMIVAQERTANLMEQLLLGGRVTPFEAQKMARELEPFEPGDNDVDDDPTSTPGDVPDASWSRAKLLKWLTANGRSSPEGWINMKRNDVWEYVRALMVEA